MKDLKDLPSEQCFTWHKPLAYDYKKVGDISMFLPYREIWKLHDRQCKEQFQLGHYIQREK